MRRTTLAAAALALAAAACTDPIAPRAARPTDARTALSAAAPPTAAQVFATYVALGTSLSMGVQSAGIYAAGQQAAWPARLAARVGTPFSLPLVQDPGCGPPLAPPLAVDVALIGAYQALGGGGDPVGALMGLCAPSRPGVVLPANSVAISGADVHDALTTTVAAATALSPRVGALYSRVLRPGQTQVSAMVDQHPSFVSVELATNDVLPASTGNINALTPYARWEGDFDQVLASVASTGARAVLVGLPDNAANFPSVRRARELFEQAPYLLALGIRVNISCYFSPNYIFVPGYVLSLLQRAPATATCADVPGTTDYVLTPDNVSTINALMARMNAHMRAQADARGYAYFAINVVYDQPKARFDVGRLLFSDQPFGPLMSLDGVHPNAQGQEVLAAAAARAVNARYGLTLP